jgi:hypothetical protein
LRALDPMRPLGATDEVYRRYRPQGGTPVALIE